MDWVREIFLYLNFYNKLVSGNFMKQQLLISFFTVITHLSFSQSYIQIGTNRLDVKYTELKNWYPKNSNFRLISIPKPIADSIWTSTTIDPDPPYFEYGITIGHFSDTTILGFADTLNFSSDSLLQTPISVFLNENSRKILEFEVWLIGKDTTLFFS
ncbi:MAG: hypothetical protein ABI772_12925, partial [Bacteroidota bacterium]